MTLSPSTALPASAIVELARTRDDLAHWFRLRLLHEAMRRGDVPDDGKASEELDGLLREAWPAARRHAGHLADFYDTHADAVNAAVREAREHRDDRLAQRLAAAGDDIASAAAARARDLAGEESPAPAGSPESDFCGSLATWQEEADVMCIISGDPADCAYASLVASLSDQYC